ncbi:cobalamin biosynthesis protein CbiX [Asanoa ishikariensis]|uniref:Sirohydrochlorin ferrochelatase n=1 Tax=Asanoa ishikariensis TaxID=137265 RepID=A0A1H3MHV6_9ACTN|nr:CbiX/SirB N-terminal domain-containing protein [Asanoa ishikariensis]GIF66137.1 cobalamin biosynthesis protein CbiX [Asanoa ishikariensis]SDY76123.1 Sirohydrochlorin ferrochelatase [Asanoa ishikariensis]
MTLVLVAHGTRVPAGQAQVRDLARRVARRYDGAVRLAYVDVQEPHVRDVAAGPAVVVPLLLTTGHHVRVDIAEAFAGLGAAVAPPLGTAGRLLGVLADRLAAAGPADAVVLAAAGSSDPWSRAEVDATAAALPVPATVGYAASAAPTVPDAVRALRADGADRVLILTYLLADGRFHQALHRAGADVVTPPLADHPAVVDVVLDLAREPVGTSPA